jgi:acetyl esterase/lipase
VEPGEAGPFRRAEVAGSGVVEQIGDELPAAQLEGQLGGVEQTSAAERGILAELPGPVQWFWDQYTTDPAQRAEITASPLRATVDDLAGLPPALVITGEADVLRDEGEAYAAKLRAAGVPVTAVRYQGIIHDFVMLNALHDTYAATAAIAQAVATLRAALNVT